LNIRPGNKSTCLIYTGHNVTSRVFISQKISILKGRKQLHCIDNKTINGLAPKILQAFSGNKFSIKHPKLDLVELIT